MEIEQLLRYLLPQEIFEYFDLYVVDLVLAEEEILTQLLPNSQTRY